MSNRTSTQGVAPGNPQSRTSLFYANVIPAGGVLPVPCAGTQFYVTAATAPVSIRPSGGVFNAYEQGTGLQLDETNAFSLLEVRNDNAYPIAFQIFVGFDQYIDNRLVLGGGQPVIGYPTYPVANAAATLDIPDKTGSVIADINGNQFYALSRVAVIICNTDTGVTLLLHKAGATLAGDPAVAAVFPTTSLRYDASGHFSLTTGGGNLNCIVSELYNAIPKS